MNQVVVEKKPVVELSPTLKRYEKFLTVYHWNTAQGNIVLMPILRHYGESIEWSPRIHKKGVAGPLAFNDENAALIGATPDLIEEVESTKYLLEREFKALPTVAKEELFRELAELLKKAPTQK
jgi:hypothetical protein